MLFSFRFLIPKQSALLNFGLFRFKLCSLQTFRDTRLPIFFLRTTSIFATNFLKAIYPLGRYFEKWFLVSATASRVYFHLIIMKREDKIF